MAFEQHQDHEDLATLHISGTDLRIGISSHKGEESSVYIQTDESPEPTYMNTFEALMIVAALEAAVYQIRNP
jgi:hypothetical protein